MNIFPRKTYKRPRDKENMLNITDHREMWIKTTWDTTSHVRTAKTNNTRNNRCWRGCREKGTLWHCWGTQTGAATVKNSLEGPQKVKNRITQWSSKHITGDLPNEYTKTRSKKQMHAGWLKQHYLQQPRYGSSPGAHRLRNGWRSCDVCIDTDQILGHYSAIKMNDILPFARTWMELESVMLSEVSQRKKYHMISLVYGTNLRNKINEPRKERKKETNQETDSSL